MKKFIRLFQIAIPSLLILSSSLAMAVNEVKDFKDLRKRLGVDGYKPSNYELSNIKVAVLDNGFTGYQPGKGMLPESTEVIKGVKNAEANTSHGLGMAQIVWAVTGKRPEGPKFYLINTNGFTNFKAAIDFVIANKVDIVIYSQVWEFGSNFDGKGFINAEVNRATDRGVIWLNAAGNFSKMIYNGTIDDKLQRDNTLMLRPNKDKNKERDYLRFENKVDENKLSVVLSWTDFKDDEKYNAVKDLDLYIYNEEGKEVGSSKLIQSGMAPPEDDDKSPLSSYAREIVSFNNLDRGMYQIKVVSKTKDFFKKDQLRILIKAEKANTVTFTDRTAGYEILPPADNPSVFTVGENTPFSSEGPTADGRVKPNVLIADASVTFTNGNSTAGTSDATAIMGGQVVLMKAMCKNLSTDDLIAYAAKLKKKVKTDEDLAKVDVKEIANDILNMIPTGGKIMQQSNGHLVIMSPVDPLTLDLFKYTKARRQNQTDIITVSANKNENGKRQYYVYPVENYEMIGDDLIEFRRLRSEIGIWDMPKPEKACVGGK